MGAKMLLEDVGRDLGESFADFAFRIIEPSEHAGSDRAGFHARRLLVPHDAVVTPGTLVSRVRLGIDESRSVGTCLHAVCAAECNVRHR